jgi:exonuclease V gamma subunit
MFGELNEKQDEYVKDIHASGAQLLSLINDILALEDRGRPSRSTHASARFRATNERSRTIAVARCRSRLRIVQYLQTRDVGSGAVVRG